MDDEFALCWNNFQDNIASGFQNLFDRGDLIDVTIACDGKLLHAHKIVLAICSPYFQEMFITNPCKHPIIILKDISYTVMCELLQFMYQGVVNVKHAELSSFMKIAQTLQIKGLTTAQQQKSGHHPYHHSQNNEGNNNDDNNDNAGNGNESSNKSGENGNNNNSEINEANNNDGNKNSASGETSTGGSLKRAAPDFFNNTIEGLSIFPRKQFKRFSMEHSTNSADHHDITNDSVDNMNNSSSTDDVFLPPIPQISMIESRLDINHVKKENLSEFSSSGMRNALPAPFNFEYGMYAAAAAANKSAAMAASSSVEYPNELHMPSEFTKGIGSSMMDIPSGSNITMLSSTSLLHGNCIFNRNNTVATQQGMKTYWLCKSYRITMCRARCITHQGRVISATGVHNHPPHMKSPSSNDNLNSNLSNQSPTNNNSNNNNNNNNNNNSNSNNNNNNNNMASSQASLSNCLDNENSLPGNNNDGGNDNVGGGNGGGGLGNNNVPRLPQAQHHFGSNQQQLSPQQQIHHQQNLLSGHHHHHHHQPSSSPSSPPPNLPPSSQHLQPHSQLQYISSNNNNIQSGIGGGVLQNMMQNVLSQNNLMHLTNMAPMLNNFPPQHSSSLQMSNHNHHHHHHHLQSPSNLHVTPLLTNSPSTNRSSSQSNHQIDSPNLSTNSIVGSPQSNARTNDGNNSSSGGTSTSVISSSLGVSGSSKTSPMPDEDNSARGGSRDHHERRGQNSNSNIISSIRISPPPTHGSFKMEHIFRSS